MSLQIRRFLASRAIALVLPGVPGDYNQNGTVDAADYAAWRDNEGTTNALPNDPIGGTIGAAQYNQWRANFGVAAGAASRAVQGAAGGPSSRGGASALVPEPYLSASLCLVFLSVLPIRMRHDVALAP